MERKRLEQEQQRLHREQQFKDRSKQRTKEMIKWLSVFTSLFLAITLYHLNWLVSTIQNTTIQQYNHNLSGLLK